PRRHPIPAAAPTFQKLAAQATRRNTAPPISGAGSGAMGIARRTNALMRESSAAGTWARMRPEISTLASAAATEPGSRDASTCQPVVKNPMDGTHSGYTCQVAHSEI
ncbi:hypothetical protein DNK59_31525, partial [Pseudomonas sp. TKO26]